MPQSFITSAVHRTVRALPGYPRLEVLDLACGSGEILSLLEQDGCSVRGTRLRDDDYILEGAAPRIDDARIDRQVDLGRRLPYADSRFDLVLLTEVVEHLGDYQTVLYETGRVLRPGGHLVLTSPNLQRLHSRARFFWTGTHKLIRRRPGWDVRADQLYAYHISPVDFPLLHTLLHQAGLRTIALGYTRVKRRHAFWLLLYPALALATRFELRGRGNALRREGERDLRRFMLHPALLLSEQLLLTARREGGAFVS